MQRMGSRYSALVFWDGRTQPLTVRKPRVSHKQGREELYLGLLRWIEWLRRRGRRERKKLWRPYCIVLFALSIQFWVESEAAVASSWVKIAVCFEQAFIRSCEGGCCLVLNFRWWRSTGERREQNDLWLFQSFPGVILPLSMSTCNLSQACSVHELLFLATWLSKSCYFECLLIQELRRAGQATEVMISLINSWKLLQMNPSRIYTNLQDFPLSSWIKNGTQIKSNSYICNLFLSSPLRTQFLFSSTNSGLRFNSNINYLLQKKIFLLLNH